MIAFAKPRCWNLYLDSSGATLYGGASWLDPDTNETVTAPTEFLVAPDGLGTLFAEMKSWRHVALVLDATTDTMRGYVDGERFRAAVDTGNTRSHRLPLRPP